MSSGHYRQRRRTPRPRRPAAEGATCRSGRESAIRSAPPTTAWAPTSRSSPRWPRRSSCACSTSGTGTERRVQLSEVDAYVWHAYLPGIEPGPALRLPGARPVRPGRAGCAATRTSCCSTRTPRRSTATSAGTRRSTATTSTTRSGCRETDSAPYMPKSVVVNPYFDWGNDRPPRIPYHHSVIYEAHVKGLTMRHPDIPEELRGTYAGDRLTRSMIEHLTRLGRDRDRADAGAPVRPRPPPGRPGAAQLLGLQHHRLLRPAPRLLRAGPRSASRCRSSEAWSRRCTRPASR